MKKPKQSNLRNLLLAAGLISTSLLPVRAADFDLTTATIKELGTAMETGALTSEELVQLYLARIEAYDKDGPKINAVISINPDAVAEARALDLERKESGPRSPIHGMPVVLKDLIDVEGMVTTAGFTPFGDPVAFRDATIVARIQEAGGIILAKVATTNWFGRGFEDTHPIGETLNPYNLEHTAGGSSNGSGAAIAASFAPLAIGTDTSVSVQNPAASTSSVGFVGTYGMVSRAGIVPRGATQDRPGPITKSVYDAAALFSVISGWDAEDMTTANGIGSHPMEDWSKSLKGATLAGKRIGVLREMFPEGEEFAENIAIIEKAIEDLRAAGAQIVDPVLTGNPNLAQDTSQPRMRTAEYEKIHYTDAYLARLGPNAVYKTTREMMDKVGHDKFSNSMVTAIDLPPPQKALEYQARYRARLAHIKLLSDTMDKFDLDAFVLPFNAVPLAYTDTSGRNPSRGPGPRAGVNSLSSSLGLPAIVVPAGYSGDNLPMAVQFIGKPYTDQQILQIGYAYEQATNRRIATSVTPPLSGESFSIAD